MSPLVRIAFGKFPSRNGAHGSPAGRRLPRCGVDIVSTGELDSASAVALFEAAVLVRCTGVCGGSRARVPGGARARTARTVSGVLAEFNRADAAARLAELLLAAGRSASMHTYTAGDRHRYDIHRIVAGPGTDRLLHGVWHLGYAQLCCPAGQPRTARQLRHARLLSCAAWRAALMVGGPARSPGLRIADLETATALVRAGRTLDLPVRMSTRPGGQLLLSVPPGLTPSSVADAPEPVAA